MASNNLKLAISGGASGRVKRLSTTGNEPSYTEAVNAKVHRARTTQSALTGGEFKPTVVTTSRFFKELIERLRDAHIDTGRIRSNHYRYLLPPDTCTKRQNTVFSALLQEPMTVTRADLSEILEVEESKATSPPTEDGNHFYIRGWTFTPEELQELIASLQADDNTFEELEAWESIANTYSNVEQLTIRYIGTCQGPLRPWDRHEYDMIYRNSGILHHFLAKLDEILPVVANAVVVDRISVARVPRFDQYKDSYATDDTERMLIALFNGPRSTLLNRQLGGWLPSYVPETSDRLLFEAMNTQMYDEFLNNSTAARSAMRDDIGALFDGIQLWANDNPDLSGASKRLFSDDYAAVCKKVATPRQYKGYTLLAFIGQWVTFEDYYRPKGFIAARSRSGALVRNISERVCGYEEKNAGRSWTPMSFEPEEYFTFMDLHVTLRHDQLRDYGRQNLQAYFMIVKPLVICSFSLEVNSVMYADFRHSNGLSLHEGHLWRAGSVTLHHYSTASDSGDDDAFLNISHLHPGYDQYGPQLPELRRVYFLTMAVTHVVVNEAMKTINAHRRDMQPPSRLEICKEIFERVQSLRTSTRGSQLFDALEEAKDGFLEAMGRLHSTKKKRKESTKKIGSRIGFGVLPSESRLPLMNNAGIRLLKSLGQPMGDPGSPERAAQLIEYWNMHYPDLHVTYHHTIAHRQAWDNFYDSAPEGQYWLLHALTEYPDVNYVGRLLHAYRPANAAKAWYQGTDARQAAAAAAGVQFAQQEETERRLGIPHYPTQRRQPPVGTPGMEGLRVIVAGHADEIKLIWRRHNTDDVPIEIAVAPARMRSLEDSRKLVFTKYGIDVINELGEPLRDNPNAGQTKATVPCKGFLARSNGSRILDLWRSVRKFLGHDPETEFQPDGKDWGVQKGIGLVKTGGKLQQNNPPERGDANYLLFKFLEDRLPLGGTFHTASKARVARSTEDLQHFVHFLRQYENCRHPYADEWLAHLARDMPNVAIIGHQLKAYFSVNTHKSTPTDPHTGKKIKLTYYSFSHRREGDDEDQEHPDEQQPEEEPEPEPEPGPQPEPKRYGKTAKGEIYEIEEGAKYTEDELFGLMRSGWVTRAGLNKMKVLGPRKLLKRPADIEPGVEEGPPQKRTKKAAKSQAAATPSTPVPKPSQSSSKPKQSTAPSRKSSSKVAEPASTQTGQRAGLGHGPMEEATQEQEASSSRGKKKKGRHRRGGELSSDPIESSSGYW